MSEFLYCAAWEWINIAMEYTAGRWARLPRFFGACVLLNLLTHPFFMFFINRLGRSCRSQIVGEAVVWAVEWALLCLFYRQVPRLRLLLVALSMNAASCLTGILLTV